MARTQIIAEVGANHGGDVDLAVKMIEAAAQAGADWVKFQSWQAKNLKPGDPNFERHAKAELSDEAHHRLMRTCEANQVNFLTTCFDIKRVEFLAGLGLHTVKVASPDLGSRAMIRKLRERFDHLIISTGMSYDEEVQQTAEFLGQSSYTFLHCVSFYPAPLERVNLARMEWLRQFTPSVGFSDHTLGTAAGKLAIARGAVYLEKHFTLSRELPGKDQAISAEPREIRELADYAGQVERMTGEPHPGLSTKEIELRGIYIGKWGNNR